ncbi:hypothetical protein ONZ45_g18720 [Pleurotus djamor]|nr:hypothetical protein ONZ45_g18720 [Pleurotus djamor]
MGCDWCFGFMSYSSWWRQHRKLFNDHFNPITVLDYQPAQITHTHLFLRRLLEEPHDFIEHIRLFFAGSIMEVTYGIRVNSHSDSYVSVAEQCLAAISIASVPGRFLVDTFPILKHIPTWFPGAEFKRLANGWSQLNHQLVYRPLEDVKEKIRQGIAKPSVAQSMLESAPDEIGPEYETLVRNCAGIAYAGGADTTVSTIQTFFLAMAMHPDAQAKAQAELDAVVGHSRLPTFADQSSLTYIEALTLELARWNSVSPLALPHASTSDDTYEGYFIPKGTIVLANSWAILNNPDTYPEPERFKPERFLINGHINKDILDPREITFGYGRRYVQSNFILSTGLR